MFYSDSSRLIARIDHILATHRSEAGAENLAEALAGVLLPAVSGADVLPDVTVVLHALEHPAVLPELATETLAAPVQEVLQKALHAVAPLVGPLPVGPLWLQARRFRERYDIEQRKYELVSARLERLDPGVAADAKEATRMLVAYFNTAPAALFVARMRRAHAGPVEVAEAAWQTQFDVLVEDEALVAALATPPEMTGAAIAEIRARIARCAAKLPDANTLIPLALQSRHDGARLVAGALAVHLGRIDEAPRLVAQVLAARPHSAAAAVCAARLDPELASQGLSRFLIDMFFGNPEDPDMELTPDRREAIAAARCVLPLAGSPLPEVHEMQTSDVPELVARLWRLWE